MGAVSLHLEVALGPEYTYQPGPPFVYEGDVAISLHLNDAKGLLDDVGINGSPEELDRLADALHDAATQARTAEQHVVADTGADKDYGNGGAG